MEDFKDSMYSTLEPINISFRAERRHNPMDPLGTLGISTDGSSGVSGDENTTIRTARTSWNFLEWPEAQTNMKKIRNTMKRIRTKVCKKIRDGKSMQNGSGDVREGPDRLKMISYASRRFWNRF